MKSLRAQILMSHAVRVSAACIVGALAWRAPAVPDVMARDQMIEIANEHYLLRWYCDTYNLYTGIPNATCPYTVVGFKDGMPYKWGGYDTRDGFWTNVVVNHGYAGDTNSAAIVSGTYGDDCSGYASRIWRSGRYVTSNFANIATAGAYTTIAPGDLMNLASSHCRVFEKYTGTNLHMEFECTTGVSPGRVTRRVLSTNSSYIPLRYNYVVQWPSLVQVRSLSAGSAFVEFLGAASTGFRVYRSTDNVNWTQVANEATLGPTAQSVTISGLTDGVTYYFRVTALNGSAESVPSCVFPIRISPSDRKALVVSGYDRWTRKTQSAGNPHAFLQRYATAMAAGSYAFDTVDNVRVQDGVVPLASYSSVWWMLGDESTADESFAYQEQLRVQTYLAAGGKLFVSGSEIAYEIITAAGPINDSAFLANYLKASYISDGASGNGYAFTGAAGTPFSGVSGGFDNGTGGTYNVQYPDVLGPVGGSQIVLKYPAGTTAALLYKGTFGAGSAQGAMLLSGIPFETITTSAAREAMVGAITTAFFGVSSVGDWTLY